MAIIQSAATIISAIGVVSGGVFARRHHTNYVRRPYGPARATAAQRSARNAFAAVDQAWQQLHPDQRQMWRDWQAWRKNWGYNRFQATNIPRQLQGLGLYLEPGDIP